MDDEGLVDVFSERRGREASLSAPAGQRHMPGESAIGGNAELPGGMAHNAGQVGQTRCRHHRHATAESAHAWSQPDVGLRKPRILQRRDDQRRVLLAEESHGDVPLLGLGPAEPGNFRSVKRVELVPDVVGQHHGDEQSLLGLGGCAAFHRSGTRRSVGCFPRTRSFAGERIGRHTPFLPHRRGSYAIEWPRPRDCTRAADPTFLRCVSVARPTLEMSATPWPDLAKARGPCVHRNDRHARSGVSGSSWWALSLQP